MTLLESLRFKLEAIQARDPIIHMDISLPRQKIHMKNIEVRLLGTYKHVFQIEEYTEGKPQHHTMQYTDIVVNHVRIEELDKF